MATTSNQCTANKASKKKPTVNGKYVGNYIDIDETALKVSPEKITSGHIDHIVVEGEKRYKWTGVGSFDILMEAIDGNLRVQYDNGRITGPDYAQAYAQLVQSALQYSLQLEQLNGQLMLQAQEMKLKDAQMALEGELSKLKQENMRAQSKVLERQVEGFSDSLKLKLLQAQFEAFSTMFSAGMLDFDENSSAFPTVFKSKGLDEMYNEIKRIADVDWMKKFTVEQRINKADCEPSAIEL